MAWWSFLHGCLRVLGLGLGIEKMVAWSGPEGNRASGPEDEWVSVSKSEFLLRKLV